MSPKVMVIGLDGGTFSILRPLMDAGHLPTLKAMCVRGSQGDLASVVPPITAPAWSSFMTGKNPGKHGIYDFLVYDRHQGREVPVSATLRSGRTLWQLLGEFGKRVLVLNVPTTYPPEPVNGVMVSDFLTPPGKRDFAHPLSVVEELESRFGPYPLYFRMPAFAPNLSPTNTRRFLQELREMLDYQFKALHYLMEHYPSDFIMMHIWGVDRIQHELWNFFDPTHPLYDADMDRQFRPEIVAYYSQLDTAIGKLLDTVGDEATLFIISDHGFGPIHKMLDLNSWLLQEGYIVLQRAPLTRLRYAMWRAGFDYYFLVKYCLIHVLRFIAPLIKRSPHKAIELLTRKRRGLMLSLVDVDWSATRAFCKSALGGIYLNIAGVHPFGAVDPSAYHGLREEIVAKLKALRDPDTGEPIDGNLFVKEEVYTGPFADDGPDIIYLPMERGYLPVNLLGFASRDCIMKNFLLPGNHHMHGMLIAAGGAIETGVWVTQASLMDLAPTILYLLGAQIPSDTDGKVLHDIITAEFRQSNPVQYTDSVDETPAAEDALSAADRQNIISRLEELGYL
jgi:predicted AlkP superfamily phosphohydrolase/phosphomutase